MNKLISFTLTVIVIGLSGCTTTAPCEDILEVKRQEQQCAEWRRLMTDKNHPQQALTARKRYEEACRDIRYYRDQYDTICPQPQKKAPTRPATKN